MRVEEFKIDNHEDLHLLVLNWKFAGTTYIVEDILGTICGGSKKSWKQALYNYNRNKKRRELKNGRRKNM